MSDSVANLTVKVDVKSVAAATKALEALASAAKAVETKINGLGGKATGLGKAQGDAAEGTKKASGALAAMEKRIDAATRRYDDTIRMVSRANISERERRSALDFTNAAFERHIRVIRNANAGTLELQRTNIGFKNSVLDVRDSVKLLERQEAQRVAAARKNAKELETIEKKRVADSIALQSRLQQAQGAVQGITLRAGRQLSPEAAPGITRQAEVALARYTTALNTYGVRSLEAGRAAGAFGMTMRGLSSEIARVGGLLPRISDNARVFSAAFGAANASLGGFSRVAFNTSAALSALSGTLALREIIQAGLEIDKFVNTLKTVSEGSLGFQRNLNFLFEEANRVGFAVGDVGNSFARLSLAMKGAGFQGAETREVFSELVGASRNFGLSSAETMGVIRALEQSMSKGKFMAEEVRNQMGDRLPVAMAALERAVTKVDGKQSDLNKRFEEGTIDTKRYAVEFVRQIYALSGGAETLSRTSQSVGSAFGRLTNELTKTNMLFKEAGFDEALISTTDQIRKLIETARESGAVEVLAKSLVTLANNLDMVAGALTAFAAVGFVRILTALASKWVAIGIAVAAVGAAIASSFRGPERDLAQFEQTTKQFDKTYAALNDRINTVNQSLASGTAQAASSAESNFERLIRSYEKLGFAASKALEMALKVQVEENKKALKDLESQLAEAGKKASEIITDYTRGAQAGIQSETLALGFAFKELEGQLTRVPLAVDAWVKSLIEGKMPLSEFQENLGFLKERLEKIAEGRKGFDPLIANVQSLIKVFESPINVDNIGKAILEVLRLAGLVERTKAAIGGQQQQATAVGEGRLNDVIPPLENLPMAPGSRTRLSFSGYVSVKEAQDVKAGEQVLQEAYRQTSKDTKAVVNTTLYLAQVRAAADAKIPGAQKILDDYNAALAKNDTKTTGAEKSLRKYTETLQIELDTHQGLLEAYKQSTLAGEDMEVQIKAQTKALDYGVKGSEAYKKALAAILPLMRERTQQEKDTEAVKAYTKQREDEIALLEKERSLLGESVALREQELAAFRARQQLKGSDPGVVAEAEQLARKTAKLRQENQQLENSYNEVSNIGVRAFEQVGDAITEAFAKGEIRALNFGNVIRGVMSSIIQSILRLGVINPVINSIFSGTMLPTLGAGLSILGGGGAAAAAGAAGGAAAGGGGGLGSLLGLSSLLPKEGIFGSLGLAGSGGMFSGLNASLFGTAGFSGGIGGAGSTAGTAGLFGTFGSTSIGGVLGGAGLGFGAGMFVNNLLGGNQMGGTVGSGVGALGGALLAAGGLLGPLGLIAGGLLGGVLGGAGGGMIGPKPSSKGFSYNLGTQGGRLAPIDYRYFNEQGREQFQQAEAGVASTNALLQQFGLTATGGRAVGGNRFGMGNLGYGEAASFSEAFKSLQFAATSNEELSRALSTRTFEGVEKLQEFLQGFVGLQETIKGLTADPVPEFTQQMDALIESFVSATIKAREYGINEDQLMVARKKQIAILLEQRRLTIQDMTLGLQIRGLMAEGMDQEAERLEMAYRTQKEIISFTEALDALAVSAEEKSKLLVELERVQSAERAKIIKESTRNILEYLDSLRTGPLSGTTTVGRLGSAQEIFSRDLGLARSGDEGALNRITQSADTLLNLARETYGSTIGFHDIREQVVSGLESLTQPISYEAQILAALNKMAEKLNVSVTIETVRIISETLNALPDSQKAALVQSAVIIRDIQEKIGRYLTDAEFDNLVKSAEIRRAVVEVIGRPLTTAERDGLVQSDTVFRSIQQAMGRDLSVAERDGLVSSANILRSIQQAMGRDLSVAERDGLLQSADILRSIQQAMGRDLSVAERDGLVQDDEEVKRIIQQAMGRDLSVAERGGIVSSANILRSIQQAMGRDLSVAERDGLLQSADILRSIQQAMGRDLSVAERNGLVQSADILRSIEEVIGRPLSTAERALLIQDATITQSVGQYLGRPLTTIEMDQLFKAGQVLRTIEQDLGTPLTSAERALVFESADVLREIFQSIYGATGSELILGGTVQRNVDQAIETTETIKISRSIDDKIADALKGVNDTLEKIKISTDLTAVHTMGLPGLDIGGGSDDAGSIGGPFALGGVFHRGRVTAYANGGIPDYVNSPTMAPMALFGEAGPEAIMPLRRGSDGRLGVEVNGEGSQAVVAELRAVRQEIVNLRGSVEESDNNNEGGGVVDAIAELRVQVGGLREELRTARLRAQ